MRQSAGAMTLLHGRGKVVGTERNGEEHVSNKDGADSIPWRARMP